MINVENGQVGDLDDAALECKAALVGRRTRYYAQAWRLAVVGGTGFAVLVGLASLHMKQAKAYYAEQREAGKKVVASVKSKIHKRTTPPHGDSTEAVTA